MHIVFMLWDVTALDEGTIYKLLPFRQLENREGKIKALS